MFRKLFLTLLAGALLLPGFAKDDSLIVHLKFDEGNGNITKDHSGKGHDAKLINTQWDEIGVRGKAVRFNGKDSYVEIPWAADLDLTEEFTYSVWIKMEKTKRAGSLFVKGNYFLGFQSYIADGGMTFFSIPVKGKCFLYSSFSYGSKPLNPYYYVVITCSKGKNPDEHILRYYINGKLRPNPHRYGGEKEFVVKGKYPVKKGVSLTLGKHASAEGIWFKGLMDEAKVYNRALTAAEIAKEYKLLSVPESGKSVKAKALQKVTLPPLKKTNAAIYVPAKIKNRVPVKTPEWFEQQLAANNVKSIRISDGDLVKLPGMKNVQTLIMPYDMMALEGEDAIFKFLKRGGNVIAATCSPIVYDPATGKTKHHSRGWFAPFLIRPLDPGWAWARRDVRNPLAISDDAAKMGGDLFPAVFPANPRLTFLPIDRWNVSGGYGDGTNYALASDVMLELYKEHTGIPADFVIYRYYNAQIFGSSFVNFGTIGRSIMRGEKAPDIFKALLHFAEMKFPKEQDLAYYQKIRDLSVLRADLAWEYMDLTAKMRDAGLFAYSTGKDYKKILNGLLKMDQEFQTLFKQHKELDQLLASNGDPAVIRKKADAIAQAIPVLRQKFALWGKDADSILASARTPVKPAVKHKYGTMQLIASLVFPTNLNRMRGDLFPEMKRMGVTVYSGQFHEFYVEDPAVRQAFKGISRDHKFVYALEASRVIGGGSINPTDGKVKEGRIKTYPKQLFQTQLKPMIDRYTKAGIPQFRIGTGDETGLGYTYWGKDAEKELQAYVQKYYKNSIQAMNAHCGTAYKSFADVKMPVHQPVTPAEHAVWEHWRNLREIRLEGVYDTFYKDIKKIKPDLDVFCLPSTGGFASPLYGINFYNISKYEDINGLDGTSCSIEHEWSVYDLTRTKLLTSEWGGCYTDLTEHGLIGLLWREVGGGMAGAELHVFGWGSDSISFINQLNQKTLRGAAIGRFMKDIRKLDHVLLDGARAVPEIGILYSQTTRMHDQKWGANGEKTYSAHRAAICSYYALFLQNQRSARVIPEEKIMEEGVPPVKILILPQAKYLSEALQKKLVDYVKKGGILLAEGRAGAFDAFGKSSDLIFREAQIIPSYTAQKSFRLGNTVCKLPEGDSVFSPSGKGRCLTSYASGECAVMEVPCGKGKIIISGLNPAMQQYGSFAAWMENILRTEKITPRFIVSDKDVLTREWKYKNDTYLLLTRQTPDLSMKEIEVKIRGNVKVEDYDFGNIVPSRFVNGYTVFKTLQPNGGHVFLLRGSAPAALPYAPAEKEPAACKIAGNTLSAAKEIALPYKGRIYDDGPLKWKEYQFTLSTISAGYDDTKGETYLTITSGRDRIKKRLLKDQTVYFRMKKQIFKVKSTKNFCKYPFHCELTIETAKDVPAPAAASVSVRKNRNVIGNDMISCEFHPDNGAALTSMILKDRISEQITRTNAAASAAFTVSGWGVPGIFHGKPFSAVQKKLPDGSAELVMKLKTPSANRMLLQKVVMPKDVAGFRLSLTFTKLDSAKGADTFRWHPELAIGGSTETGDMFFFPVKDGVKCIPFRGLGSGQGITLKGDWTAIIDTNDKLAYISAFDSKTMENPYYWESKSFYTMELEAKHRNLKNGESQTITPAFYFVRGLENIQAWKDLTAVSIGSTAVADQTKLTVLPVTAGTACLTSQKVTLSMELLKNGKVIKSFPQVTGNMVYEMAFDAEIPLAVRDLPDGEYAFAVTCRRGNGTAFRAEKKVQFAGKKLAELTGKYLALKKKIEQSADPSSRKVYEQRIKLEELRREIAAGEIAKAEKIIQEMK